MTKTEKVKELMQQLVPYDPIFEFKKSDQPNLCTLSLADPAMVSAIKAVASEDPKDQILVKLINGTVEQKWMPSEGRFVFDFINMTRHINHNVIAHILEFLALHQRTKKPRKTDLYKFWVGVQAKRHDTLAEIIDKYNILSIYCYLVENHTDVATVKDSVHRRNLLALLAKVKLNYESTSTTSTNSSSIPF